MITVPPDSPLPRRGNWFTAAIGRAILRIMGWQIAGTVPDSAKVVVIFAPHTSNWDWVLGITCMFTLRVRIAWMGKDTLFRGLLAGPMRWFGGVPINRNIAQGTVAQTIAEFERREAMVLVVAPEGTRKKVTRWKTGFYHIAHGAGVPICPISLDYTNNCVTLHPLFHTTGNMEDDMNELRETFRGMVGKFAHAS